MKKHRILLVSHRRMIPLAERLLELSEQYGWQPEYYAEGVPENWDGDGVISDIARERELNRILNINTIPVVSQRPLPQLPHSRCIYGDVRKLAVLAADFLMNRGFRSFAVFDQEYESPRQWSAEDIWRYAAPALAVRLELEQRGMPVHYAGLHAFAGWTPGFDEKLRRYRRVLAGLPRPCGCFTNSVETAQIVYRAAEEEKILIPQELAVLSNCDIPILTERMSPPLSAVSGETGNIAIAMAAAMDKLLRGEEVPARQMIPPGSITARQSTNILAVPHKPTARALGFLLEHFREPIGIPELAERAGVSAAQLHQNFRKFVGRPPVELLRELRLEHARELLRTGLPLREVARQTGYGSDMALSLAFKRRYNQTPGSYRLSGPIHID